MIDTFRSIVLIMFWSVSASFPGASDKLSEWVIEWASEWVRDFFHGLAQQWRPWKKQNLAQGSLGDEDDDARTLNTHMSAQYHT